MADKTDKTDKTDKPSASRSSSLSESLQRVWSEALAATSTVEDELKRKLGQFLNRTGLQQGSEEVGRLASDLSRRLQRNREEIERAFDEAMRAAVTKVRDPLVEEIAALRGRAEKLAQRIEGQVRRKKTPPAPGSAGEGGDPAPGDPAT